MSNIRCLALSEQSWLQYVLSLTLPLWVVVTGVLVLAAAAVVLLCLSRRRRKRADKKKDPEQFGQMGRIKVGKVHEQGAREGQQDCFAVSDQALIPTHGLLAVVADGMGGLSDGDKVSQTVVQTVLDTFLAARGRGDPERLLLALARSAVEAVDHLLGPDKLRTSGSTLVMGLIREGSLTFLGVGDSRICLYRGGALTQLNREHTYQRELVLQAVNGEISLQEAYASPQGAGLTSFFGMGALAHVDLPAGPIRLLPGDRVVLMSDGVYNALSVQELSQALEGDAEQAAQMIQSAIQGKGYQDQDNYTAVILACAAEEETDDKT